MPKVSIVCPVYNMDHAEQFLKRNLDSIGSQTFKDYEIVISDDSDDDYLKIKFNHYPIKWVKNNGNKGMANNTNNAIEHAKGELVKILFQDDYFYNNESLFEIVKSFTATCQWLATGCTHTMDGINFFNHHVPYYSESDNTIGSPSVITFRREITERFDPNFHWTLDLDLYKRLFYKYGKPKIYDKINVVMGIGLHQKTNNLSDERKRLEYQMLKIKHQNYDTSVKT